MFKPLATAAVLAAATTLADTAAAHDASSHHDRHDVEATATYTVGDLAIAGPFSRATLPGAPVAGGFFTVTNNGTIDDRLIGAASAVAGRVEIHEMAIVDDVMRMRELPDGLAIPAGETVELKPGGYHIMFMDLKEPLIEGARVEVTLSFMTAGEITIPLDIGAPNAREADHGAHDVHHGHDDHGAHAVPPHGAPAAFDQVALSGDRARIEGLLRAMFETPEAALVLDPVLIEGDVAIIGWVQGENGGRALLERDDHGLWSVRLCAGEGLKGEENLRATGIAADAAARFASAQAEAEAALPSGTVALLDSFGPAVHFE